jgi:hypothetical protein
MQTPQLEGATRPQKGAAVARHPFRDEKITARIIPKVRRSGVKATAAEELPTLDPSIIGFCGYAFGLFLIQSGPVSLCSRTIWMASVPVRGEPGMISACMSISLRARTSALISFILCSMGW